MFEIGKNPVDSWAWKAACDSNGKQTWGSISSDNHYPIITRHSPISSVSSFI